MSGPFKVGELVSSRTVDPAGLRSGEACAFAGPGGLEVVLRVDDPDPLTLEAVEYGHVGIGVRDRQGGGASLLLGVGDPGRPGPAQVRTAIPPTRSAVFPENRYGLIQPHGPLTAEVVTKSGLALIGSADWQAGFDEVWDLRGVTEVHFPPSSLPQLDRLEAKTRVALEGSRTLLVMPPRRLFVYSARTYARMARSRYGRTVLVFRTVEEALAELSVDALPSLGG